MATSQIWAQAITDFVPVDTFAPNQAGYDAAEAYCVSKGGGFIQIGPGLAGVLTDVTPPINVAVIWLRDSNPIAVELVNHNLGLSNGFSYRFRDALGVLRSALTLLLTGELRISYLGSAGLILTDQSGNVKVTLTGTRLNVAPGIDLAFNGSPGAIGALPFSQGPAANPAWSVPVGIGPTQAKNIFYPSTIFQRNGVETTQIGAIVDGEWNGLSTFITGAGGRSHQTQIVIPRDFSTLTNWELWWTSDGVSVTPVDWRFGLGKLTAGTTSTAAHTLTNQSVAPPGVADQTVVTVLSAPGVALAAGDVYKMLLRRPGTDANPDNMRLIGIRLNYT